MPPEPGRLTLTLVSLQHPRLNAPRSNFAWFAIMLVCALGVPSPAAADGFRHQLIAENGGLTPDGLAFRFSSFPPVQPVLNDAGQVVFVDENAVWLSSPGSHVVTIAQVGKAGPSGGIFYQLRSPHLNNHGHVAFLGVLDGFDAAFNRTNGIFSGSPGSLQVRALSGDAMNVPSIGSTVGFMELKSFDDDDRIVFQDRSGFRGPEPFELGIVVGNSKERVDAVRTTAPGLPASMGPASGSRWQADGSLLFVNYLIRIQNNSATGNALWQYTPTNHLLTVVAGFTSVPAFQDFPPHLGSNAPTAFSDSSVIANRFGEAVVTFLGSAGGYRGLGWIRPENTEWIIRNGHPLPGNPGTTIQDVGARDCNDAGDVAFTAQATLDGERRGILCRVTGGRYELVAVQGQSVPGFTTNILYGSPHSAGAVQMNEAGTVLFAVSAINATNASDTRQLLCVAPPGQPVQVVVSTKQALSLGQGDLRSVAANADLVRFWGGSHRDAGRKVLDEAGRVALFLTFTNQSSAVVLATPGGNPLTEYLESLGLQGADASPGADPDHDHQPNIQEIYHGTSPKAGSTSPLALGTGPAGELLLTWPVALDTHGITVTARWTPSLSDWRAGSTLPPENAGRLADGRALQSVRLPRNGRSGFIRLEFQ